MGESCCNCNPIVNGAATTRECTKEKKLLDLLLVASLKKKSLKKTENSLNVVTKLLNWQQCGDYS